MAVTKAHNPKTKSSWPKRLILSWLCIAFLGWLVLLSWALISWVNDGFEVTLARVNRLSVLQTMIVHDFSESSLTKKLGEYVSAQITPHSYGAVLKAQEVGAQLTKDTREKLSNIIPKQQNQSVSELMGQIIFLGFKAQQFWALLEATGQLILIKLAIIMSAIPLFLLAITAGFIDGLNQRAIRTASLGRESTYVFHKSIPFARKALFWVLGVWLAMPQAFSPSLLFVSLSVLLSFIVSVTSSRFKKYL